MSRSVTAALCPRLTPGECGVGDYTWRLHQEYGAPGWRLLVANDVDASRAAHPGADVRGLGGDAGRCAAALDGVERALLQYAPYGFDPTGAPTWLVDGLRAWKRPDRRLVVTFHEIHALSPPWRRGFWRAFGQRRVYRALAELADVRLTSAPFFQATLERLGIDAALSPVPANVPEREHVRDPGEQLRVAVFGLADKRRVALDRHAELLRALAAAGRLERLVVVGAGGATPAPAGIPSERVAELGPLSADGVAAELANSDLVLLPHAARDVGKSGVAAAALSCGCAIVLADRELPAGLPGFADDGSSRGARDLLERLTPAAIAERQAASRRWYDDHASWERCVSVYRDALAGPTS